MAKAEPAKKNVSVEVVMRRVCRIGEDPCEMGQKIGTVTLEPGVSLNFLVDAIRNGLAGEKKKKPKTES